MQKFESPKKQEDIIFKDLRGKDLSNKDFSETPTEDLETTSFDTETIWPPREKLPLGFNPELILQSGKNPGLGIRELHHEGIDGSGITVAIIDQKLDTNHPEYQASLASYSEYGNSTDEDISMHGPAVASLLVGKDCGVAPGAKLIYKAVPSRRNFLLMAEALKDIIIDNKSADDNKKVKIVSCSVGYSQKAEPGLNEWAQALAEAQKSGIIIVDVNGDKIDLNFCGGGSSSKDKNDFETYTSQSQGSQEIETDVLMNEENMKRAVTMIRAKNIDQLKDISDADLEKKITEYVARKNSTVLIPSDHRTMASSWNSEGQYLHDGQGGISWSVPYLAGIVALALQVNPKLNSKDLSKIIQDSAITNKAGLKIINPQGIVTLSRKKN